METSWQIFPSPEKVSASCHGLPNRGHSEGNWSQLGDGISIGHKHIQPVKPVTVDALRVVTTRNVGTPFFRSLAAFHTGLY